MGGPRGPGRVQQPTEGLHIVLRNLQSVRRADQDDGARDELTPIGHTLAAE